MVEETKVTFTSTISDKNFPTAWTFLVMGDIDSNFKIFWS